MGGVSCKAGCTFGAGLQDFINVPRLMHVHACDALCQGSTVILHAHTLRLVTTRRCSAQGYLVKYELLLTCTVHVTLVSKGAR
jgi:hypothetical protein